MKKWILVSFLSIGAAIAMLVVAAGPDTAPAVAGTATQLHVELVRQPGPRGGVQPMVGPIPPDGSSWHELYPMFCATYSQEGYEDNGDGVVSACDRIRLSGKLYHIVWAGPTYWTTCSPTPGGEGPTVIFEPTQPGTGGNPICEVWHEIHPNFCREMHIDSWHDNGDGVLSVCDVVDNQTPTGPLFYHIDRIECDITIVEIPTSLRPSTWSRVKGFIGGLF
jgi:hypothetical protein